MSEPFSGTGKPDAIHNTCRVPVVCPRCGSHTVQSRNRGKKLGGALGTCAGVVSALTGTAKGATAGAVISLRTVGPSTPMNSLTAAVLGAMVGGAMGCASGAALGQVIDDTVLNNQLCLNCGHFFSTQ